MNVDWEPRLSRAAERWLSRRLYEAAIRQSVFLQYVAEPVPRSRWRRWRDAATYRWLRLARRVHRFVHLDEDD